MRKRRVKSPSESLPVSSSPSQCAGFVANASAATGSRRCRPMYTLSKSTNRAVRKRRAASARSAEVTLVEVTRASSPLTRTDAYQNAIRQLLRGVELGPRRQQERLDGCLVEPEGGDRPGPVVGLQEGEQDVPGVDALVVEPHGLAERQLERLLGAGVERDEGGDRGDGRREGGGER